jgi:hypothetical protein
MQTFLSAAVLALVAVQSAAFYLPGVAPHSYVDGENVDLKVNKLRFVPCFEYFFFF